MNFAGEAYSRVLKVSDSQGMAGAPRSRSGISSYCPEATGFRMGVRSGIKDGEA